MDGKSLHLTQQLLQQLQQLVPQAFTEGKLDTVALKRLLGEDVFVQGERYGLNWAGKTEAYQVLQQQTTTTLLPEPEQSVDWDQAEHVLIEGENLEVLKLLQKSYFGQVKMIYIDPPYNTGSDSFIYPDKFSESKEEYLQRIGDKNDEGYMLREGAFRPNRKENGQYHSNWLNMMLPRLYLARNLLRDDGVIFVSIDDNEAANLKLLMDEVFGAENFVASISWKKRSSPDARDTIGYIHDWILCYVKTHNLVKVAIGKMPLSEKRIGEYSNPDNDPRGAWASVDMTGMTGRATKEQYYSITLPSGRVISPPEGRSWGLAEKTFNEMRVDNRIWFGKNGDSAPRMKKFLSESEGQVIPSFWDMTEVGSNEEAKKDVNVLMGRADIFDTPKPIKLIQRMLKVGCQNESVILDFFAGSGTTAQAVMELNEADGGNRRYICVQLPEKTDEQSEAAKAGYATIADITAARIKKVIAKIEAARAEKTDLLNENKPLPNLGFRKFTLAPSNFKLWRGDVIETEADLVRQMHLFTTPQRATATTSDMAWELLLKNGYGLSEPVTVLTLDDGLRVYHTADGHLALVLDGFSAAVQDAVLTLRPKQVLLLDSLFAGLSNGDAVKTNAQLTFEDQGIAFRTV